MPKFETGDTVYHATHGTGTITDIQTLDVAGTKQLYYVINLAIGEVLMIPVEETEEARLHRPLSAKVITRILTATPEELADDYRQRRHVLETKINSGDPKEVSEAVRDLTWREHTTQLSNGDKKLLMNAKSLLANVLVGEPELDMHAASKHLEDILKEAAQKW